MAKTRIRRIGTKTIQAALASAKTEAATVSGLIRLEWPGAHELRTFIVRNLFLNVQEDHQQVWPVRCGGAKSCVMSTTNQAGSDGSSMS